MPRQVTGLAVTELPVASGNWDTTRAPIDRVIIHTMVGTTQSAANRFNTPNQAAAHYGVSLDGSVVHWVDEDNTAYHAGDYPMNQRSIGIEHEDNGDYNGARTDALYAASANLVRDICEFYNLPINRTTIRKHSEVSDAPTGCPDALDIDRIVRQASQQTTPVPQPTSQSIEDSEPSQTGVVFTTQTKIPIGVDSHGYDWGEMELGAVRSTMGDQRSIIAERPMLVNTGNPDIPADPPVDPQLSQTPPIAPSDPAIPVTASPTLFSQLLSFVKFIFS